MTCISAGCAHGAPKEWWTDGRGCGSMVDWYGVDGVNLWYGVFYIFIDLKKCSVLLLSALFWADFCCLPEYDHLMRWGYIMVSLHLLFWATSFGHVPNPETVKGYQCFPLFFIGSEAKMASCLCNYFYTNCSSRKSGLIVWEEVASRFDWGTGWSNLWCTYELWYRFILTSNEFMTCLRVVLTFIIFKITYKMLFNHPKSIFILRIKNAFKNVKLFIELILSY